MNKEEMEYLKELARPEVYAMELPKQVRDSLLKEGFVEWLPPPGWGSNNHFGITPLGKKVLEEVEASQ